MNNPIVCSSCGARFIVRPAPGKTEARCPKCGEKTALGSVKPAAGKTAGGKTGAGKRDDAHHAPRGRKSASSSPSSSSGGTKLLVWGAVGGGIALLLGLVLWLGGGGAEAAGGADPAANPEPAREAALPPDAVDPAKAAAETADPANPATPAPAADPPAEQKPAPAPGSGTTPAAPPPKAAAAPSGRRLITSPDQVYDPKKNLEPLPAPADVTEEEKAKFDELLATMRSDPGAPGKRAGNQLAQYGHKALYRIVNQLRDLDYLKASDTMYAYQLNLLLQEMLQGANAGFKPPELQEEGTVDLQTADFNAQTVFVWFGAMDRWNTKEKYDTFIEQKKRSRAEQPDPDK